MFTQVKPKRIALALAGSAILAFGLYNVHSLSNVTEGGVLGMTLLLQHWFGVSPSVSGLVMNAVCYALGWKLLGKEFLFIPWFPAAAFPFFTPWRSPFRRSGLSSRRLRSWRRLSAPCLSASVSG